MAVVLALTVVLAVTATTASATSLASLKAQARAANARVNELYVASEQQVQHYDAVHQRYVNTRTHYRQTLAAVKVAKYNLKVAKNRLAASLTRSYKSGNQDPVTYMLAAKSVSDLVNQVQLYDRTNSDNSDLLKQVTTYRHVIAHQKAVLKKQTAALQEQNAQSEAAKNAALTSLQAAQDYKANLNVKIRNLIDQQAAAAAAAAAQAAAAAANQPSSGGGGGGGGYGGSIPIPPSSSLGGKAVAIAEQYLGVPYVYGGASPSGFDCSGLVMYVYAQLGVGLPHNAAAQYASLPHVPLSALQPGDLVFFYGFGHVGIYVGNNTVIHAPHTGTVVQFENMSYMGPIAAARVPG